MECRSCGTTIADKAIVCFRCGASTAEPAEVACSSDAGRQALPWGAAVLAVAIAALGVWAAVTWIDATWARFAGGAVAVGAGAAVFVRLRSGGANRPRHRVD